MARFAPDRERWAEMSFKMEWDQMEQVFALIKELPDVLDLMIKECEVPGDETEYEVKRKAPAKEYAHSGDLKIWESHLKSVFLHAKANGNGELHVTDPLIAAAIGEGGRKPTSASPMLSYLRKSGLIIRTGKGTYRLP